MVGCPGTLEDPARFIDLDGGNTGPSSSGAGSGGSSGSSSNNCPDVPTAVFETNCTTAGCHTSATKVQGLDLQSPGVAQRLVGVMATEGQGLLIDPSSPSSSVVYTKLTAMPPFGARMPLGSMLDDATVACVLAWITQTVSSSAGGSDGGAADGAGTSQGDDSGGDDGPSQETGD